MKKTVSIVLALIMAFVLCVPALAAGESPVRLVKAEIYDSGKLFQTVEMTYDDAGRLRQRHQVTYPDEQMSVDNVTEYDENGNVVVDTNVYNMAGEAAQQSTVTSTYNAEGYIAQDVTEALVDGETVTSTTTYEYEYAPNGFPASILQKTDGEEFQRRVYTYDEKDRVTTIDNQMLQYGWSYMNEYTYDDQDRLIANMVTFSNGAPSNYWEYSYDEDQFFQLRYSMYYQDRALKPNSTDFYAEIPASDGQPGLSFGLTGAPAFTYDEAGYMTMADAGGGSYIQFTYEPAA